MPLDVIEATHLDLDSLLIYRNKVLVRMTSTEDLVLFHGGCHCGKIRFQVETTPVVDVYSCK